MILTEALIEDETGGVKAIWFHQPFLTNVLRIGDRVAFAGKTSDQYGGVTLVNPLYEKLEATDDAIHTARLVPVYSITSGITQKQLRILIKRVLDTYAGELVDWLPAQIISRERLAPFSACIRAIHFPASPQEWNTACARLAFDEMYLHQLRACVAKQQIKRFRAPEIVFHQEETKRFLATLPFEFTKSQKRAAWEIVSDMRVPTPMNRLLNGDVGSGKTAVACVAFLNVVQSGCQAAYMAPTEILAEQNYTVLSRLLAPYGVRCALLTSSRCVIFGEEDSPSLKNRRALLHTLSNGEIDVVVGTHALLEPRVRFARFGLATIDEQHRFGVAQRRRLCEKAGAGCMPHLLSMTATPIPRSLALVLYGDLDISLITTLPTGRKRIITKVVPEQWRLWTYEFIKKQIRAGRQGFVVCPLIDPSDALGARSVKQEYDRLCRDVFGDLRLDMLHGRMKADAKRVVFERMRRGEVDLLVTTSVVEVGIDVPNASIIMIEGAERFGLAQLHQLRGRVGRSSHQSYCFLAPSSQDKEELSRLKIMTSTCDGFKLAEHDLRLRGQGDVYRTRQSGIPDFRLARLTDLALLKKARTWAEWTLRSIDSYPRVRSMLESRDMNIHFE